MIPAVFETPQVLAAASVLNISGFMRG